MSNGVDFDVVNIPGALAVKSSISDGRGNWVDDPDWNREAAETQYVLAEVLAENGLISAEQDVQRVPHLVIRWSELTEVGQAFVRAESEKWMRSVDKTGMPETDKRTKLDRRWKRFSKNLNRTEDQ